MSLCQKNNNTKICSYVLVSKKTTTQKYVLMSLCQKNNSNKNMFLCPYVKKITATKICSYVFMSKKTTIKNHKVTTKAAPKTTFDILFFCL